MDTNAVENDTAIHMTEWEVLGTVNPYLAPELHNTHLHGTISRHPELDVASATNKRVYTPPIKEIKGRRITTKSGRVYVLTGEPKASFFELLTEYGLTYNRAAPLDGLKATGRIGVIL